MLPVAQTVQLMVGVDCDLLHGSESLETGSYTMCKANRNEFHCTKEGLRCREAPSSRGSERQKTGLMSRGDLQIQKAGETEH